MFVTKELRGWFTDPAAIADTAARIEAVARDGDSTALGRMSDEFDTAEVRSAEVVLDLARRFMADETAVKDCLAAAVTAAREDCFFRPPLRALENDVRWGLVLFRRQSLAIQLAVMSAEHLAIKRASRTGPSSIIFSGQRSIFRFLEAGGATLSFWEAPEVESEFTAGAAGRCRLIERRRIADGEIVEIDGRRNSFIVDHAPRDLVYLEASTPLGAGPLSREFDSESHALVGAGSTDDASSRTQMMLSLLRILDRRDAVPLFIEAAQGEHFYARWQAMRELLALDADAALPELRRMAALDPHPEIRAAAGDTLARFFADEEEEEALACLS